MTVEIKTMRVVEETLEDSMETLAGDGQDNETLFFFAEIDGDIIDSLEYRYPNSTDIAKLEEVNKLFREDKIDMAVFSYAY